jgi:predicted  nucleic acid-binding Zn-ribbon protein
MRLDRLAHRRATLPEIAEFSELTSRQIHLGDLFVAAQTEESDIGREQVKAEADVEAVRVRAARDQQRLDAGSVGSPKELESLQSELASLARRQAELEDTVLEIMERREDAARRVGELAAERETVAVDLIRVGSDRDKALAEIDGEVDSLKLERDALAGGLPAELIALYEKIRAGADGVGAAALRRGRCEGCRVELSTADLNAIKAAADDLVIRCEECRRILVRVPDSGL